MPEPAPLQPEMIRYGPLARAALRDALVQGDRLLQAGLGLVVYALLAGARFVTARSPAAFLARPDFGWYGFLILATLPIEVLVHELGHDGRLHVRREPHSFADGERLRHRRRG